jgi:hypothetical protein
MSAYDPQANWASPWPTDQFSIAASRTVTNTSSGRRGSFAEQLRDPPEQRFLLFQGADVEHGDLDVHDVGAPCDAVGIAIAEVRSVMLR